MGTITLRIEDEDLEEIDDEWKDKGYSTRSAYIRDLIMMARKDNGGKEAKIDEYYSKRDEYIRKANRYEDKAKELEKEVGQHKKKRKRLKNELESFLKREFRRKKQTLSRVEQLELINDKIEEEYEVEFTDVDEARKEVQRVLNEGVSNEEAAETLVEGWFGNDLIRL